MTHRLPFVLSLVLLTLIAGCVAVPTAAEIEPAAGSAPQTRTITHAMGETEVPALPQRVVVLDTGEVDNALALGANVVGAPVADVLQYQSYLAGQLDGITDTGTISEPNLETIHSLDPDLILGSKQRYEAIYDELSAIAPTVFSESLRVPWQENFLLHAEALGKTAEAEDLLASYNTRITEVQTALGDDLDATISVIRFRPGQVRLYLKSSYIGYILQDVGLQRPPSQDEDVFSAEISLEQIADVDADYIFVTGYAEEDSDLDTFLQSPLWQTLAAVQNEQVIDVNDDTWIAGLGVQAANLVLDDLLNIFGGETASDEVADAAFPVTIEHKYGSTTIPEEPERIVSLDFNDQDPILALGVTPVAIRYWFGDAENQVWPWAQDELGDADPEVLNMPFGELNFEAIAALQPDLIIAVSAGISDEEYETLSQIAPTVAQSADYVDFGVPWQEQTVVIGRALGQEALATDLVAEMEERFAQAQADHPEFAKATAAIVSPAGDGQIYFSGPQHERQRFLTSLGFELPAELAEIAGDSFYGTISEERLDLIDTDVLIWTVTPEQRAVIEENPLYQQLAVAQEGRDIFLDTSGEGELVGPALVFSSVLSLPVVFDELVPMLAERVATE